jgi:hypothetical protein
MVNFVGYFHSHKTISLIMSVCLPVCLSVCLSVRQFVRQSVGNEHLGCHWTYFHEIFI